MKSITLTYIDSSMINEQTDEVAEPVEIRATGFLIAETDDYVVLARELIGDEYRGQVAIPKVAIIMNESKTP